MNKRDIFFDTDLSWARFATRILLLGDLLISGDVGYFAPSYVLDLQSLFAFGCKSHLDLQLTYSDSPGDGEWAFEASSERTCLVFLPFDVHVCCILCSLRVVHSWEASVAVWFRFPAVSLSLKGTE